MVLGCPSKAWEEGSKGQRKARRSGLPGWTWLGGRHHTLWPWPPTLVLSCSSDQMVVWDVVT